MQPRSKRVDTCCRETNVRRVFVDNATTPVTLRVGSNHRASIVRLTPFD